MNRLVNLPDVDLLQTIMAALHDCYGSLENPNFYRVSEIMRANPYSTVIQSLQGSGITVMDMTDNNDDVSLRLVLNRAGDQVGLALSCVGPFAGVIHQEPGGRYLWVTQPQNAPTPLAATTAQTVQQAGFKLLGLDLVSRLIPMTWYDGSTEVTLYQALFSDSDIIN